MKQTPPPDPTRHQKSDIAQCITVSSGTEYLLITLMELEIGPGDEVIALVGATPVFFDVEADTCNIYSRLIEAAVTERTRAITLVSLYGQVPDMEKINLIGERHGIAVIEDAAQSFGASCLNQKTFSISRIGCANFFLSKPLGCYGDGGAIFTNDPNLTKIMRKIMRKIRVHG